MKDKEFKNLTPNNFTRSAIKRMKKASKLGIKNIDHQEVRTGDEFDYLMSTAEKWSTSLGGMTKRVKER
jgi:hypothetical protein